ncbi:hypothetical protein DPM33_02960 [Mesorhizobium hawassense]|uniref:Uncharacterized protein n=2 Tax=Mesorhizobium hawassense TaxID=1209954 RepID=A0A330I040_9HYPH|nr:hypothetical protein DPM33_02960 [Mesorhizobium hawassense]
MACLQAGARPLLRAILLLGLVLGLSRLALAQQICGAALSQCDLTADAACLEKTYACGEYDTIIQTLFVESLEATPDQKYFIGASFYGRHVRERAAGIQCEMVKFSREYLTDYLTSVDAEFNKSGSFGTVRQMDQIYHASQMLADLGDVTGCPESALTRAAVEDLARSTADSYARSVFLQPSPEARSAFDTLLLTLRGFVSKASDLETGIALRRVEIKSAQTHLQAIRAVFVNIFGPVTGAGATLAVNTAILDGLQTTTQQMLRSVEVSEGEFKAALGGVSPEQYANLRGQTVADAENFLKVSAFHINMIGVLLPTDPAKPFWQLDHDVHANNPAQAAFDDLRQIKADWKANGQATGICAQPGAATRIWYCR